MLNTLQQREYVLAIFLVNINQYIQVIRPQNAVKAIEQIRTSLYLLTFMQYLQETLQWEKILERILNIKLSSYTTRHDKLRMEPFFSNSFFFILHHVLNLIRLDLHDVLVCYRCMQSSVYICMFFPITCSICY